MPRENRSGTAVVGIDPLADGVLVDVDPGEGAADDLFAAHVLAVEEDLQEFRGQYIQLAKR